MSGAPGRLRIGPRCRVLVDNDWSGDPDGLVALAHHVLSPGNRVDAVTSSFLHPMFGSPVSRATDGAAMARELLDLPGDDVPGADVPVHAGSDAPYAESAGGSDAARAIAAAASKEDDLPLVVVCGGPLTNVASALDLAPDIARRFELVWVGGSVAGAEEYNRDTDPGAHERVFSTPGLSITQFPLEAYRRCAVSVAELEHHLTSCGRVGAYLWRRFVELPLPDFIALPEVWPLGDSPPVLVTALDTVSSRWTTGSTPGGGALRVFTEVDTRLLLGDLVAKLALHAARESP